MNKIEKIINHIETALQSANECKSKLSPDILTLEGMSSIKIRHFLNNLITNDTKYLEIGVWKGSTFISAMYNNHPEVATCIDNFSEFNGSKQIFLNNCNRYISSDLYNFMDSDCFKLDVLKELKNKYNIYFYDGNHDQISQELALTHYLPTLDDVFILIVDDWFFEKVRNGTKQGIIKNNLKLLYEKEITGHGNDYYNWWNGLYIAVLEKNNNKT